MSKPKAIGYLVVSEWHKWQALALCPGQAEDEPKGGPLMLDGMYCTLFATRHDAALAIRRTRRWARRCGYLWADWRYRTTPVVAAPGRNFAERDKR